MAAHPGVRPAGGAEREVAANGPLEEARKAAGDRRWLDAHEALSEFDRRSPLPAEDLELLATAAFLRGRDQECRQARLRAYQLFLHQGDRRRAARCAARIGLEQISISEVAEATGCLPVSMSACSAWAAQARTLIEREPDGAEHGYLLVPVAYEQLAMAGDPAGAADVAAQAVVIGQRFADPDLLAMALMVHGRAMVRTAHVSEGMALLDQSVALVLTGGVSPPVAGLALTAAVDTSDEAFEHGRGDEWTAALAGWCDGQEGMLTFQSRSLALQATSERRHGRWDEALKLAERACEPSIAGLDPTAAATARYQQGEVHRLRGELGLSGAAYRQADEGGVDPQPGLALRALAEGDTEAALAAVDRALDESPDALRRARLLPTRVEILLAAGERSAAAETAVELGQVARAHATPALEAAAQQVRAGVLLAADDPPAALTAARQAHRVWRHIDLPYEEAQARVLIARSCRLLGDATTARLELETAGAIFARLGARPALDRTNALLGRVTRTASHGLTQREREVLELLATGLTNRAIAEQLHVTSRTVDTHVSRILMKLGVATRAAATAFAHRHGLV